MKHTAHQTEHGFQFGPALVESMAEDPKSGVFISITTQHGRAVIRVTPGGKIQPMTYKQGKQFARKE